jgi:hypothetical protein
MITDAGLMVLMWTWNLYWCIDNVRTHKHGAWFSALFVCVCVALYALWHRALCKEDDERLTRRGKGA